MKVQISDWDIEAMTWVFVESSVDQWDERPSSFYIGIKYAQNDERRFGISSSKKDCGAFVGRTKAENLYLIRVCIKVKIDHESTLL